MSFKLLTWASTKKSVGCKTHDNTSIKRRCLETDLHRIIRIALITLSLRPSFLHLQVDKHTSFGSLQMSKNNPECEPPWTKTDYKTSLTLIRRLLWFTLMYSFESDCDSTQVNSHDALLQVGETPNPMFPSNQSAVSLPLVSYDIHYHTKDPLNLYFSRLQNISMERY